MAKKSAVERNNRCKRMVQQYATRRTALLAIVRDRTRPADERFRAQVKLSKLPRNSSPTRVRNRCGVSGRPRAYYRKFNMSRIALRDLASSGMIPGMTKSSW